MQQISLAIRPLVSKKLSKFPANPITSDRWIFAGSRIGCEGGMVHTEWEDHEQEWKKFSSSRTNRSTRLRRESIGISDSSVASGPL